MTTTEDVIRLVLDTDCTYINLNSGDMDASLERLRHLISLAKAEALAEGWEDIKSAPKDGTKFDAWDGDMRWTDVFWGIPTYASLSDRAWVVVNNMPHGVEFDQVFALTHWRHLPPPPSMKAAT